MATLNSPRGYHSGSTPIREPVMDGLSLREGALRWCAPHLVADVRRAESTRPAGPMPSASEHWDPFGEPPQPRAMPQRRPTVAESWAALAVDLRGQIERAALHLRAVQLEPAAETEPRALTRYWAKAMKFDFDDDSITVGEKRFVHARLSQQPWDTQAVITLREALIQWADSDLVEAVRANERTFTAYDLQNYMPAKLSPPSEWAKGSPRGLSGADFTLLDAAWEALMRDFNSRVLRREIYLAGVQVAPALESSSRAIPNVWASEFIYDFENNGIIVHQRRYTAATASRHPFTDGEEEQGLTTPPEPLSPDDVPGLDDETILALLEEHGRRVVRSEDAKLIAPGKVSFIPIVKRKMEHRAEQGELLPKISQEAVFLEGWIASKITHHHLPTAGTIAKTLNKDYAVLKARSNAAIQNSKV